MPSAPPPQKAAAAATAANEARSYASKDYWERRYKRKVLSAQTAAAAKAATAEPPPAKRTAAARKTRRSASDFSASNGETEAHATAAADVVVAAATAIAGGKEDAAEVAVEDEDGAAQDAAHDAAADDDEEEAEEEETDEWFFNYENVKFLLLGECLRPPAAGASGQGRLQKEAVAVLDVGCGNSPFLADMARDGWRGQLHACDFSKMALVAFEAKSKAAGVPCLWTEPVAGERKDGSQAAQQPAPAAAPGSIALTECDCRQLGRHFPPTHFDLIIDKGTMDAMLSEEDPDARFGGVRQYFTEAARLLNTGGSIVLMSHMGVAGAMAHERNWLEESLVPALLSGNTSDVVDKHGARWTIDVHSSQGDTDGGDSGGEEEEEEGADDEVDGPSVWIIRKHPRGPRTRAQPEPFVLGDIEQHIH